MDPGRFDAATRSLAAGASRRRALGGLATALLTVAGGRAPEAMAAKKRRRRVRRNAFGCVNVGGFCRNAGQCCSGICRGKKGKKRCRAHDAGGCRAGQARTVCGGADTPCTSRTGETGRCQTTTGNAGYCEVTGECFPCARDADCQPFCGPGAACVRCATGCSPLTACVGPTGDPCDFV
jgi:hypothetical protein